jgi:hypothetical protein
LAQLQLARPGGVAGAGHGHIRSGGQARETSATQGLEVLRGGEPIEPEVGGSGDGGKGGEGAVRHSQSQQRVLECAADLLCQVAMTHTRWASGLNSVSVSVA